jgi:diguanylate cyclase (GGDEF)-like protein
MPPLYTHATWLFALLLIGIFCLQAFEDWRNIHVQQLTEARRSARFVTQSLVRELEEQRRMMSVFARLHQDEIQDLIDHPDSDAPLQVLRQALQGFYPTAFAVTLADRHGTPLVDDFDGLIGDVCRANIRHFSSHGQDQPIFIHPHPEVYHYDLMVAQQGHIFFVSLRPDNLVRLLKENAALGQSLFLVKEGTRLIELGAEGPRSTLGRDIHLTEKEEAALLLRLPVAGTLWRLVVLPDEAMIAGQQRKIFISLGARSIGILILTALMLWLLGKEAKRRLHAENHARDLVVLSNTDALTGLPNRRALDDYLVRECHAMERTGHPLTVMMLDIDHFKLFNDTLGHPQGDQALRAVAQALSTVASRPRDMVGRYGGEEFLIILPDTPCHAAPHLADSMHQAVEAQAMAHPAAPTAPRITVSIGLGCATRDSHHSPARLIAEADQALYVAKQEGRNTTRIFQPGMGTSPPEPGQVPDGY